MFHPQHLDHLRNVSETGSQPPRTVACAGQLAVGAPILNKLYGIPDQHALSHAWIQGLICKCAATADSTIHRSSLTKTRAPGDVGLCVLDVDGRPDQASSVALVLHRFQPFYISTKKSSLSHSCFHVCAKTVSVGFTPSV